MSIDVNKGGVELTDLNAPKKEKEDGYKIVITEPAKETQSATGNTKTSAADKDHRDDM